jgi:hypothetical protein
MEGLLHFIERVLQQLFRDDKQRLRIATAIS